MAGKKKVVTGAAAAAKTATSKESKAAGKIGAAVGVAGAVCGIAAAAASGALDVSKLATATVGKAKSVLASAGATISKLPGSIAGAAEDAVANAIAGATAAVKGAISNAVGVIKGAAGAAKSLVTGARDALRDIGKVPSTIGAAVNEAKAAVSAKNVVAKAALLCGAAAALATGGGIGGLSKMLSNVGTLGNKIGDITSVAKGILCLPAILSGLPGILGNVAASVLGSLTNAVNGAIFDVVNGLTGLINDKINDAVNKIAGVLGKIAAVLAVIGIIEETIKGFLDQIADIFNFSKNAENCRFAAAELSKCIIGSVLGDISKQMALKAAKSPNGVNSLVNSATAKLKKPGNVIERFVGKSSKAVDKAKTQISISKLI